MGSEAVRFSELVAVFDQDVATQASLLDALAQLNLKSIACSPTNLDLQALADGKPAALAFGPSVPTTQAFAMVHGLEELSPELTPVVVFCGVADPLQRIELLSQGAALCLPPGLNATETAVHIRAQIALRARLNLQSSAMRSSHGALRQIQEDLQLGARIQQSFLPPLSIQTPAFALEARIQASWTLSGDFFDYKFITPERLALFIADISGHGVASALLASRLKAFFDEQYRNARRPARTLEQLNRMLIELGEHQQFATAVLLCLDINEGSLTYANAGHRTLYLLDREQGHYTPLPSSGPALGLFEDCEIGERDFTFLPRRKRLLAYTDGLIEFKHEQRGEWVSEEEFIEHLIMPAMKQGITDFAESVFTGSLHLSGGERWDDDVCLVVVDC